MRILRRMPVRRQDRRRLTLLFLAVVCLFAAWAFTREITRQVSTALVDPTRPHLIIDAGHGGFDGGAVGSDGVFEKDINLEIALRLEQLARLSGFEVTMIRTDDRAVNDEGLTGISRKKVSDIHNRLAVTEEHPEAIFISIHQNKYTSASIWGAQVFYGTKNDGSEQLARVIQQTLRTELQPDNKREIKPAEKNLYILSHARCPAVLVECGFLSNPDECQKLENETYQQELAFCILTSTIEYIYGGTPPEGN